MTRLVPHGNLRCAPNGGPGLAHWQNHLSLPHRRETRRRRYGRGVQSQDVKLGRFVALKFLPDDVAKNPQALSRFEREAKAASALNHPNIGTIHEIDDAHSEAFIAMEFLDGMTLRHRIGGRPLETEAIRTSGH